MQKQTCGEALTRLLQAYGVDTVFGIPGVHTIELYRGLNDSTLKHITPRHEQGAGFMADGYARVTGKPGVCFIITGPGMTNIVTAMGQALQDSIPMLVISSVNRTQHLSMGEGRLHELPNQLAITSQVSRYSHTLLSVDNLPKVLAQAFAVFTSQRPGPVHIEIPIDVLASDASHLDMQPWPMPKAPGPDLDSIKQASEMLTQAKNPLMILGGGAKNVDLVVQTLAQKLNMPVVNTCNGKGVMPSDHPLFIGSTPSHPAIREAIEKHADVVLAVGTELAETDYDFFFLGDLNIKGKLIRIDIDSAQLLRNHKPDLPILCDAQQALNAIVEHLPAAPQTTNAEVFAYCGVLREKTKDMKKSIYGDFFQTITDTLGDCVIVGDSTQPAYFAQAYYETNNTARYFHSTTGYGTLGYAFPAALGAAIGVPSLPVIGLTGDGGGQFSLNEIISAVDAKIPVIYIVWNNHGHGEIRRFMDDAKVAKIGVDIIPPDYVALANAMGCQATHVNSLTELKEALNQASNLNAPFLIEVSEAALDCGYAF
ncbi:5-guanidino-2-oxopentanoate decarboxylase [uncultured Paraglaciecola sp.]|uniref:5-guanidino-2-oxopentanoate decarboxylase n=1 Tax=uncultured Paraglaciecola sp. TaxID=1765024 RepID=UPI0030DDC566|tara:strand:- start:415599 stop:417215 length:1617 start_codon:yes stop_codon:yes gene_type:complete